MDNSKTAGWRGAVRWALLAVWTAMIVYSMSIAKPAQSPYVEAIGHWAARHGMPDPVPSEVYHVGSFFVWALLLVNVLARGVFAGVSRRRLMLALVAVVLFSALAETLQALNPARHACVRHAELNVIGGLMGLLLAAVLPWLAQRWRARR